MSIHELLDEAKSFVAKLGISDDKIAAAAKVAIADEVTGKGTKAAIRDFFATLLAD